MQMFAKRRNLILTIGLLAIGYHYPLAIAAPAPMNEQQFWKIVSEVKDDAALDIDARPSFLERHLMALDPQVIQSFQVRYEAFLLEANRWNLWGAAYLMNGGCSDDGFKYFRDWLISEGEETYKAAIQNPESLASVARRDYFELESFGYAALRAYAAKGAGELDRDFKVEYAVPAGKEWVESDLPKMLPFLAARYPMN